MIKFKEMAYRACKIHIPLEEVVAYKDVYIDRSDRTSEEEFL